jgi:quercetin dioxygenase-like cupin family protein
MQSRKGVNLTERNVFVTAHISHKQQILQHSFYFNILLPGQRIFFAIAFIIESYVTASIKQLRADFIQHSRRFIIMSFIKNIDKSQVLTLKDEVSYQKGQVVSKTLAQNDALSVTLFAFDKDEEISTHESGGDAFVTCLDGVGRITIDGKAYELHEGESIIMPAKHPHAVYGQEQFKMLLVVVF